MEPKGEKEGEDAKDPNAPSEAPGNSGEQKEGAKDVADEKKVSTEHEEEEKTAEDDEGEGSFGSEDEEEEEEEQPPEPEKPEEPVKKKKKETVEKKISENFYYNYEELCSFPYVTPDSGIPLNMLTLMYLLLTVLH